MNENLIKELSYSLFKEQPLNKYVIDSYNFFINKGIASVLEKNSFKYVDSDGEEYKFTFELEEPPQMTTQAQKEKTPDMFRRSKENYTFQLKIAIKLNNAKISYDGHIPIMLGSDLCYLKNMLSKSTEADRISINECAKDPLGYFIMKFEKALVAQEKLIQNVPNTLVKSKNVLCEVLSQNRQGFISKIALYIKADKKNKVKEAIYATLSRLDSSKHKVTVLDLLHLSHVVYNTKSQFDIDVDDFGYTQDEEPAFREALKDFIGYFSYFMGEIDISLEKYIFNTIEASKKTKKALIGLITDAYKDTNPGLTKQTSSEDDDGDEEGQDEEEDAEDMELDDDVDENQKEKDLLDVYYFPHIDEIVYKDMMLMYMTTKELLCYTNKKELDNRDDFGLKKIETPGMLMQNLFSKSIQTIRKKIQKKLRKVLKAKEKDKKKEKKDSIRIEEIIQQKAGKLSEIITQMYQKSFVSDTWGDARTGKKGVAQQISRYNLASIWASIRRCSAHSNRQNKIVKPRMIDPSQYMFIAPEETPDNDRIGLIKHFAVSTYVTQEMDQKDLDEFKDIIIDLLDDEDTDDKAWVMLDGNPLGFTSDPIKLREELVKIRRDKVKQFNLEYKYVSILNMEENMGPYKKFRMIKINTCGGRMVVPFFIVENGKLLVEKDKDFVKLMTELYKTGDLQYFTRERELKKKQLKVSKENVVLSRIFSYMLEKGYVEYLDAYETQYTNIALDKSKLKAVDTHMLLNPEFMLGVTASLMTFIGHNPTPRTSLYDNHIKQAVGVPSYTFRDRMEPDKDKKKIANYPQKRLVSTYMDEIIGTDMLPFYQNVLVAIYPFTGEAEEDAIIVKKSFIERGGFSSTIYQTYSITRPSTKEIETLPKEQQEKFKQGIIRDKMKEQIGTDVNLKSLKHKLEQLTKYYMSKRTLPVYEEEGEEEEIEKKETKNIFSEFMTSKFIDEAPTPIPSSRPVIKRKHLTKEERIFNNLVDAYKDSKGVMAFIKTRKMFEDFCKDFGCEKLTEGVKYNPPKDIKTYKKRLEVEKDEPLAFVEGKDNKIKTIRYEGEKGVVDEVERDATKQIYRVRICDYHTAMVGDKIAGPYAQKGVIAAVVPDEDLPCVAQSGIIPDVFINPLAFPSRLTIGLLLEAFLGKIISSPHTKPVSATKSPFYVDAQRTGVPVFDVFRNFCAKHKNWNLIKELRKEFEKSTQVEQLGTKIDVLFKKIVEDFKKKDIKLKDLSQDDQAVHEMLFKKFNTSNLVLTFGSPSKHRVLVTEMGNKIIDDSVFDTFYRKKFAKDFVGLRDLTAKDRDEILEALSKLKEYGKPFQKFDFDDMSKLAKTIGLGGVGDKEYMIDGMSGKLLSETLYRCKIRDDQEKLKVMKMLLFDHYQRNEKEKKRLDSSTYEQVLDESIKLGLVTTIDNGFYIKPAAYEKLNFIVSKESFESYALKFNPEDFIIEEIPIPITVGVVAYLILKHYVHDKIQARDVGGIDLLTRQSIKGKKNEGGNRFGEMEKDVGIAHNVPHFVQERLNMSVDNTTFFVCQSCKQFCTIGPKNQTICSLCKDDKKITKVYAPYSLKVLSDYNAAMGIKNYISTKIINGENVTAEDEVEE